MNMFKSRILPVIVAAVIIAGAYLAGASIHNNSDSATASTAAAVASTGTSSEVAYATETLPDLYAEVSPAVVEIQVTEQSSLYFGIGEGIGSGFVIDTNGYILTNNHVVSGATDVKVVIDEGTIVDATIVGTDEVHDLALIKVDGSAVAGITPLEFANSDDVLPGQTAIALGSPYGLDDTITVGIISGLDRTIDGSRSSLFNMLQTDAAISPGNSGGPLLNAEGKVIGINTAIQGDIEANDIGFAIPSNTATSMLPSLMAGKEITRPWLGISAMAISPSLVNELSLPAEQGVYVTAVVENGAAAAAGLIGSGTDDSGNLVTGGDIITAIDGKSIKTVEELSAYIVNKQVGDTVTLTVLRDGQTLSVDVILGIWPETTKNTAETPDFSMPWGNNGGRSR